PNSRFQDRSRAKQRRPPMGNPGGSSVSILSQVVPATCLGVSSHGGTSPRQFLTFNYKLQNYSITKFLSDSVVKRFYCVTRQAAQTHKTGAANRRASILSSIPPWPGRIVPESFTAAPRLISDSTRSPSWA